MKVLQKCKDGGPKSPVDGYFLWEIKGLCSVALLKFNKGSRENYHSHAFNAFTWFISGNLMEVLKGSDSYVYSRSLVPKFTPRDNCHRVIAYTDSWCFTVRGPWSRTWKEYDPRTNTWITLTNGRRVVDVDYDLEVISNQE